MIHFAVGYISVTKLNVLYESHYIQFNGKKTITHSIKICLDLSDTIRTNACGPKIN